MCYPASRPSSPTSSSHQIACDFGLSGSRVLTVPVRVLVLSLAALVCVSVLAGGAVLLSVHSRLSRLSELEASPLRFAHRVESTMSLPSLDHHVSLPSSHSYTPRFAVATLLSLSSDYCRAVLTNYHALLRVDPLRQYDFLLLVEEDQNLSPDSLAAMPSCAALLSYRAGNYTAERDLASLHPAPAGPGVLARGGRAHWSEPAGPVPEGQAHQHARLGSFTH